MFSAKIEFNREEDHKFENKMNNFSPNGRISFKTEFMIKNFWAELYDDVYVYSWDKKHVLQTFLDILNYLIHKYWTSHRIQKIKTTNKIKLKDNLDKNITIAIERKWMLITMNLESGSKINQVEFTLQFYKFIHLFAKEHKLELDDYITPTKN